MAQRMVGLIGPGKGPKILISGCASFEVLNAESDVIAFITWPDGGESEFPFGNGRHIPIDDMQYVQFSYDGTNKTLICTVHRED